MLYVVYLYILFRAYSPGELEEIGEHVHFTGSANLRRLDIAVEIGGGGLGIRGLEAHATLRSGVLRDQQVGD